MYRTILVALDGSKNAERVLPYVEAALRGTKGQAVLLQVIPEGEHHPEAAAEAYLKVVRARFVRLKFRADCEIARGDPAVVILRAAERRRADLVAFTSHGEGGLAQWVFGSVAQKLLRGCARPLLVARPLEGAPSRLKRILVPLDGSVGSEATLPHAAHLARSTGATVELLHVVHPAGIEAGDSKLRTWLDREKVRMKTRFSEIERSEPGVRFCQTIEDGDAAERIAARAGEAPGTVVVMGSHGRTGISRWVYGSVSEKLLQVARVPVLIARHTAS
jgi:nucleotide-binding universal stress UspA family protein